MGYSSSALFVSSSDHSLVKKLVHTSYRTIFTSFNISLAIITLFIITILNPLMRPLSNKEIKEVDTKFLNQVKVETVILILTKMIEHLHKLLNLIDYLVYLLVYFNFFYFIYFFKDGFSLDLNLVSWSF